MTSYIFRLLTVLLLGICTVLQAQSWTPVVDLSPDNPFDAEKPEIASDGTGRTVAVWINADFNTGARTVLASTTADGVNWTYPPVDISLPVDIGRRAFNQTIAASPAGRFVAVWERRDAPTPGPGFFVIEASTSTDGVNWSMMPATLSLTGQNAGFPTIACDSSGRFVATWQRSDGANTIIQAATSTDGSIWTPAAMDLSAAGQNALEPQIAADGTGRFVAVWRRSDGTNFRIQASTSTDGINWSPAATLSAALEESDHPQIAGNNAGRFIAVWERTDLAVIVGMTSTSTDGSTWSPPIPLSATPPNEAYLPYIASDPTGLFAVAWGYSAGTIQTSTTLDGTLWSSPVDISGTGIIFYHQIAANPLGGFGVVLAKVAGPDLTIEATISSDGVAWTAPTLVASARPNASECQITVDAAGRFIPIWVAQVGTGSVYITQASSSILLSPPSSASGFSIANRFLTITDWVNVLNWTPSPAGDVSGYRIYRNGTPFAVVSAQTFTYEDHTGRRTGPILYQITALDSSGGESAPIAFIVQ